MLDKFRETAITWDKANRKVYEPLRVSAGDNKGRKLSVQVFNGGVVENITGSSLSLFWETRDKERKGLDVFTAVDATKGEFEIYYTTGMLSNEGVLNANLVLVDTSGRVVSEPFTITVFKGIDDDAIQSSDSFTALTEALIDVSNLEQKYAPRLNDLTAQLQQTEQSLNAQLAHKAQQSTVEATGKRIDELIIDSGNANAEVTDAHVSVPRNKTYDTLSNRLNETEDDVLFSKTDFQHEKEITAVGSFEIENKSILYPKTIENEEADNGVINAVTPQLVQGGRSYDFATLLPGETIDAEFVNRKWQAYNFKEFTWSLYGTQTNGTTTFYRLSALAPSEDQANLQNASSWINTLTPENGYFKSIPLTESGTIEENSMYLKGADYSYNILIKESDFDAWNTANGGNNTINDYVNSLNDFEFYARLSADVKEVHTFNFNIYKDMPVFITPSDLTCGFVIKSNHPFLESDFTRYEAVINNPLSNTVYSKRMIQIYATFEKGECLSEKHITVTDETGLVHPHQWENERTVNFEFDKNVGRYSDGSLKSGTIWINDTLSVGESKRYFVDVYNIETSNLTPKVTQSVSGGILALASPSVTLKFEEARKMTLSNIAYAGSDKWASSTDVITLRYRDTEASTRDVLNHGSLVSCHVRGSGVHFKEFEGVWDVDGKLRFTLRVRLYANDIVSTQYYAQAITNLAETDCYGTFMQTVYPITATRNFYDIGSLDSKITGIDWVDGKTKIAVPYYAQGDVPRDDDTQPTYPAKNLVAISNDRALIAVGWEYGSMDTVYSIDKDEVFSGKIVMNLEGYTDSTNNETLRIFNQPVGFLTKEPIMLNQKKLMNKLIDWTQHVDYRYVSTFNPNRLAYPYMSKFILYKYKDIGTFEGLLNYFKDTINEYFGGGTEAGLINAYQTTTSAGYQISSRIIPMAKHYRDECIRLGDTANQDYMETLLKAYAELSCQLIETHGFTPLMYDDTTGNSNSVASGLKALSIGLELDPDNIRWQNAFVTNYNYLLTMITAENIIQENGSTKLQRGHYLHYTAYAMFDLLQADYQEPTFKPLAYVYEAISPQGAMKEQEYCISASRRGLGHTNGYVLYGLIHENTPYSIEQASRVADNLIAQANLNGMHKFPLEQWNRQDAVGLDTSLPFEVQTYGEAILLLDERV